MKRKIGVVFGAFAPLHRGHIDLIQRAKRQCDQVWVVVSGYEGDRGELNSSKEISLYPGGFSR